MPIRKRVHDGIELTTTIQTLLTFGTNLVEGGGVLMGGTVTNRSTSRRKVTIYKIPSGGSAADLYCVYEEYVPPSRTVSMPGGPWFMDSGGFVQGILDTGTDVAVQLSAFEEYITSAG